MLGWEIIIYKQTNGGISPATMESAKGEPIVAWTMGWDGLNWLDPLVTAKQALSERARLVDGIESLEGRYKQVGAAAEECGIGEQFRLSYKMLSKCAHPSAMQILFPPDEARAALQKDCFFSQGCLFFTGAFVAVEGQLL